MALSQEEIQSIVSAVLSSLQTNSKTIEQLTPVQSLATTDYFEINGGKKVSYGVLKDLIASLSTTEQNTLKTLINKCELSSVSISVTGSDAKLSISSVGKTITCSIPVASTIGAGLITPTEKANIKSAYDNAKSAKDITDTKGQPNGLATLDGYGKVPDSQLPDTFDDVKEFGGFVQDVSYQMGSTSCSSTDSRCGVVYDTIAKAFRLLVGKSIPIVYYPNWADRPSFGTLDGFDCKGLAGKIYVNTETDEIYRWDGSDLRLIGKKSADDTLKCLDDTPDELTRDILEELLIVSSGIYKNLYFRFNGLGNLKYITISSENNISNAYLLARGYVASDGLCTITPVNDSGVAGYALLKKINVNSNTQFSKINIAVASEMNYTPKIRHRLSEGFRFINSEEVNSKPALNVREINLRGNLIDMYLHVHKGEEETYLQLRTAKNKWEEGSKALAVGAIRDNMVEMIEIDGSGVSGHVLLRNIRMAEDSDIGYKVNPSVCGNINESPEIRFRNCWKRDYIVSSDGTGDFTSLLKAVLEATKYPGSRIYVSDGIYDIYEEFKEYYGIHFFVNFDSTSSPNGIKLSNRVSIEFSPNTSVIFNYYGSNSEVHKFFAPFVAGSGGFSLRGLKLSASNCRCCVNDAIYSTLSYANVYENCVMKLDNRNNPNWGSKQCIAGALGGNGFINISDCDFESLGISDGYGIVSYHNYTGANSLCRIYVRGCRFEGKSTFRFSAYGEAQSVSTAYVTGCSLGAPLSNRKEVDSAPYENAEIVEWGNEIRDMVYLGYEIATDEDIDAMLSRLATATAQASDPTLGMASAEKESPSFSEDDDTGGSEEKILIEN